MTVKIVKSASRIFEILELFNAEQRPLPAIEVADRLGYPLASTHEILKTMLELGYFVYGEPRWTYYPSKKLVDVVDWVYDFSGEDIQLYNFLAALNRVTKEAVNLSRQAAVHVKILKVYECLYSMGISSKLGTTMPVTSSLTGVTSLAALTDRELEAYLKRLKNRDPNQYASINYTLIEETIDEIQRNGTALRCDLFMEGVGAICLPVISPVSHEALVVGVVGPSDRVKKYAFEHQKAIKRLVKEFDIKTKFTVNLRKKIH